MIIFEVKIKTGNAAVADDPETALYDMLQVVAEKLADGDTYGRIKDYNGNTVGSWSLTVDND